MSTLTSQRIAYPRLRSLTLLSPTLFLCTIGCDVQKIDSHLQGPTTLHGRNAAIGVLSYGIASAGVNKDLQASTCRQAYQSDDAPGVRLGTSASDLPVTIIQEPDGRRLAKIDLPRGSLTLDDSTCPDITSDIHPGANSSANRRPELDGSVKIACSSKDFVVKIVARFQRCGD